MYRGRTEREQCKLWEGHEIEDTTIRSGCLKGLSKQNNQAFHCVKCIFQDYEVDVDFLQVLVIRADMKCNDDLTRIVDTTISTFGQIDILVSCDEQTFFRRVML